MKEFWRPKAWKFVVLSMLVLAGYAVFQTSEPLDFHESWSPAEREQILECFRKCCDANSSVNKAECAAFIDNCFPQNGSWAERACNQTYFFLGSYSQGLLFGYLNKSTRRMIEETASTGNVLQKDRLDCSLLICSLAYGFNDLAVSLIERGADVHLRSVMEHGRKPGDTPLSWAVSRYTVDGSKPMSECRRVVDCLLAHGADLKAPAVVDFPVTFQGVANLLNSEESSSEEAEEFLIYLLEKGAPSVWKNSDGETVYLLALAIRFKRPRLARYLLDHGADSSVLRAEEQKNLKEMLLRCDGN